MMIEIKKINIDSDDAKLLLGELNQALAQITGNDGTGHFRQGDVKQSRSVFLIGYIDGEPYACGALRAFNQKCGEIKRVYARKNAYQMGTRMLEALEKEAVKYHYQRLVLETRIQNKHAISFNEKNGYIHCPGYGVYVGNENSCCFTKEL